MIPKKFLITTYYFSFTWDGGTSSAKDAIKFSGDIKIMISSFLLDKIWLKIASKTANSIIFSTFLLLGMFLDTGEYIKHNDLIFIDSAKTALLNHITQLNELVFF